MSETWQAIEATGHRISNLEARMERAECWLAGDDHKGLLPVDTAKVAALEGAVMRLRCSLIELEQIIQRALED